MSLLGLRKYSVAVAKDLQNQHKNRFCVDYSNTINIYTELDAYPFPRIDGIVNKLSKYKSIFKI